MIERGGESILHGIIDNINEVMTKNESDHIIGLDILDRERYIVLNNEKKKQYYGMIRLYKKYTDERPHDLIWREEVVFYNLTERRNSLSWKDYLAKICMYEAVGCFIAICKTKATETAAELRDKPRNVYNWREDYYEQVDLKAEEADQTT